MRKTPNSEPETPVDEIEEDGRCPEARDPLGQKHEDDDEAQRTAGPEKIQRDKLHADLERAVKYAHDQIDCADEDSARRILREFLDTRLPTTAQIDAIADPATLQGRTRFFAHLAKEHGPRLSALVFYAVAHTFARWDKGQTARLPRSIRTLGEAIGVSDSQVWRLVARARKAKLLGSRRTGRGVVLWVTSTGLYKRYQGTHPFYWVKLARKLRSVVDAMILAQVAYYTREPIGNAPGCKRDAKGWKINLLPWMEEEAIRWHLRCLVKKGWLQVKRVECVFRGFAPCFFVSDTVLEEMQGLWRKCAEAGGNARSAGGNATIRNHINTVISVTDLRCAQISHSKPKQSVPLPAGPGGRAAPSALQFPFGISPSARTWKDVAEQASGSTAIQESNGDQVTDQTRVSGTIATESKSIIQEKGTVQKTLPGDSETLPGNGNGNGQTRLNAVRAGGAQPGSRKASQVRWWRKKGGPPAPEAQMASTGTGKTHDNFTSIARKLAEADLGGKLPEMSRDEFERKCTRMMSRSAAQAVADLEALEKEDQQPGSGERT